MAPEHVIVTGGAGYVGAHVCKALAEHGSIPVALDTLERGVRDRVQWGPFVHADAGSGAALRDAIRCYRPIAMVHTAAYAFVPESIAFPAMYYRNNLVTALEVMQTAVEERVPYFVFSSTCAVYGEGGPTALVESAPVSPISPYGWAKAIAEREMARLAMSGGVRLAVLRLFNVVGSDAGLRIGESRYTRYGRLVPDLLGAALAGRTVSLARGALPTRDGTAVRDYVHAEDVGAAHVRAIAALQGGRFGEEQLVCNVASGAGSTVLEVLAACRRASGRRIQIEWGSPRPGDPASIVGSIDAGRGILGWEPRRSLEDAVNHAWQYLVRTQA